MSTTAKSEAPRPGNSFWGPYLSGRQRGTVREDYSSNGDAWSYFPHDHARSRAYRWCEDGLAGISDEYQRLCFALALWNGQDPILKERLFGLTNGEGNHGEDVKEYYYYLDATPNHSYLKMLYKYPQAGYPYEQLVQENRNRGLQDNEFELIDTGVFDENRYWDVFIEYFKAAPDDILVQITMHNRGPDTAELHVLPQLWFRNTWSWVPRQRSQKSAHSRVRFSSLSISSSAPTTCTQKTAPICCSVRTRRTLRACKELHPRAIAKTLSTSTLCKEISRR